MAEKRQQQQPVDMQARQGAAAAEAPTAVDPTQFLWAENQELKIILARLEGVTGEQARELSDLSSRQTAKNLVPPPPHFNGNSAEYDSFRASCLYCLRLKGEEYRDDEARIATSVELLGRRLDNGFPLT